MKKWNKLILILFLVGIDFISKYIIRQGGGFYICNEGIAFGLDISVWMMGLTFLFFLILFVLSLKNFKFLIFKFNSIFNDLILNFKIYKFISNFKLQISNLSRLEFFGIILIFSGAISNLIDRFKYGCVTDFINIKIWPVSSALGVVFEGWPIFNFADVFITVGVGLLIYDLIFKQK